MTAKPAPPAAAFAAALSGEGFDDSDIEAVWAAAQAAGVVVCREPEWREAMAALRAVDDEIDLLGGKWVVDQTISEDALKAVRAAVGAHPAAGKAR